MKSYLALPRISAKAHRRQYRMTVFCIVLAVFLVTSVFSMTDFFSRAEYDQSLVEHGNWHIMLHDLPDADAAELASRADMQVAAWYDVQNYDLESDFFIQSKPVVVAGVSAGFDQIAMLELEGRMPNEAGDIVLSRNLAQQYDLPLGAKVTLETPGGSFDYQLCGLTENTETLLQYDAAGAFISQGAFQSLAAANAYTPQPCLYLQFKPGAINKKTIAAIKQTYGEESVSENTAVLGLLGLSTSNYIVGLYLCAAVLMLLVLLAGVLMISGSLNTNVAERTQYFGLLRCLGASQRQVRCLVRREALSWCRTALPLGLIAATLACWGICAVLRYGIGGEWSQMPLFKFSPIGLLCGTAVGLVTVLLAARSPARKAARVSPAAAVSGASQTYAFARRAASTARQRVEVSLGMHHALSGRKNLLLMIGSFALSITLFLSFSVMLDWIGHALNTVQPDAPDIELHDADYTGVLSDELRQEITALPGVSTVYGRMYSAVPVRSSRYNGQADLISYDERQFDWAQDYLVAGDLESVYQGRGLLSLYDKNNPYQLGDCLQINGQMQEIAAIVSDSAMGTSDVPGLICSESTFGDLTGESSYAVIDVQVDKNTDEELIGELRDLLPENIIFSDRRAAKQETNSTYYAFTFLVYGFLALIALITVFNIINSLSLSVSARSRQYGMMRAIGMEGRQLRRLISTEALTYAALGSLVGCALGLPLCAWFHNVIISRYFGELWRLPWLRLLIILAVVIAASALAVLPPTRRTLAKSVTETLHS